MYCVDEGSREGYPLSIYSTEWPSTFLNFRGFVAASYSAK